MHILEEKIEQPLSPAPASSKQAAKNGNLIKGNVANSGHALFSILMFTKLKLQMLYRHKKVAQNNTLCATNSKRLLENKFSVLQQK